MSPNMYTVHVRLKLPIDWQIYPDRREVSAVITELVQDLEEDLIAPSDVEDSALIWGGRSTAGSKCSTKM